MHPGAEEDLKKIRVRHSSCCEHYELGLNFDLKKPKRIEIVIPGPIDFAVVHIANYLGKPTRFELRPNDKDAGFTREEIIWGIVQMYRYVYAVEEETMPELSTHENPLSLNRSTTSGRVRGSSVVPSTLDGYTHSQSLRSTRFGATRLATSALTPRTGTRRLASFVLGWTRRKGAEPPCADHIVN